MPSGVHFSCIPKESQDNTKEPHFHPFIITKEDGSKIYGFSLVFYEQVLDETIISAVSSLQKLYAAQIVEIAPKNANLTVFEEPTSNSKSLPRHFKVNNTRLQLYDKAKPATHFDCLSETLLVSKCICLIGQFTSRSHIRSHKNTWPFIHSFRSTPFGGCCKKLFSKLV